MEGLTNTTIPLLRVESASGQLLLIYRLGSRKKRQSFGGLMGVEKGGRMSLDFCGAYHLVPVKEDTGAF